MDWSRGYACSVVAYEVNVGTWADGPEIGGVESATIDREEGPDAPLIESGSISLTLPAGTNFGERYVRLAVVAEQGDSKERVDVCTLLCSASRGTIDRGADSVELDGRSVLYPASVTVLGRGTYLPKGTDGMQWCAEKLEEVLNCPGVAGGSFHLADHFVFDFGTTVLDAVWQVLSSANRVIQVRGDGTVAMLMKPSAPALTLDAAHARLLSPGVEHELDWSEVPNQYIVVDDKQTVTVTNNERNSPTSKRTRGYLNTVVDTSPTLVDGESVEAYARRKLEELSTVKDSRTYTREWWPSVWCSSVVEGSIPSVGLDGTLRVGSQSIELGHGITVTETAYAEVKAWQA